MLNFIGRSNTSIRFNCTMYVFTYVYKSLFGAFELMMAWMCVQLSLRLRWLFASRACAFISYRCMRNVQQRITKTVVDRLLTYYVPHMLRTCTRNPIAYTHRRNIRRASVASIQAAFLLLLSCIRPYIWLYHKKGWRRDRLWYEVDWGRSRFNENEILSTRLLKEKLEKSSVMHAKRMEKMRLHESMEDKAERRREMHSHMWLVHVKWKYNVRYGNKSALKSNECQRILLYYFKRGAYVQICELRFCYRNEKQTMQHTCSRTHQVSTPHTHTHTRRFVWT